MVTIRNVLALCALALCPLAWSEDQISPPSTLTIEVTDQMTENVWNSYYGVNDQQDEYYGPTYYNLFFDDPSLEPEDGVWSGIPDPGDYNIQDPEDLQYPVSQFVASDNYYNYDENGIQTDVYENTGEDEELNPLYIGQFIQYNAGASSYEHMWTITNYSEETTQQLALRYGGGATYGNYDWGIGFATPAGLVFGSGDAQETEASPIVYVVQPESEGFYSMFPAPGFYFPSSYGLESLVANYQVGDITQIVPELAQASGGAGVLANTVDSDYYGFNPGVGWEFLIPPMPGAGDNPAQLTIDLEEAWSTTNTVQVQGQYNQAAAVDGIPVPVTFTVSDNTGNGGSYYLIAQGTTQNGDPTLTVDSVSGAGVDSTGAVPVITFPDNDGVSQSVTVTVMVTGNPSALGSGSSINAYLSLLALSTQDPTIGDQFNTFMEFTPALTIHGTDVTATCDIPMTLDFTIQNHEQTADTFTLSASAATGISIAPSSVPASVTIPAGGSQLVSMVITGSSESDLADTSGNVVSLTAVSAAYPIVQATETVTVAFSPNGNSNEGYSLTAPADVIGVTGAIYQLVFTLSSDEEGSDTFWFQSVASPGLTIVGSSGTLPADLGSQSTDGTITETLLVYASSATESGTVSLIASSANQNQSATATVNLTFAAPTLLSGPTYQAVTPNAASTATFTISNQGTASDQYALTISPSASITVQSITASPVTCPGGQTATVTVGFTASGPGTLAVTATSVTDSAFAATVTDNVSLFNSLPLNKSQSTPVSNLTVAVGNLAADNVWDSQNGVGSEVEEYQQPTGFNLFLDPDQDDGVWSGITDLSAFTSEENVIPFTAEGNQVSTAGATSTIQTDVTAGQVEISQSATYQSSSWSYEHTWTLSNYATTDAQNLVMRYGGIGTLGGNDNGIGLATPAGLVFNDQTESSPIVYAIQPGTEGFYAIFPAATNAGVTQNYQEGPSAAVIPELAEQVAGDFDTQVLTNSVDSDYATGDAAVGWEFQIPGLASPVNEDSPYPSSVSFSLYEAWGSNQSVQVLGQSQYSTSTPEPFFIGAPVPVTFTVTDTSGLGGSYYLVAQGTTVSGLAALSVGAVSGSGVNSTGAVPVLTLAANGQSTITVMVTGSLAALGESANLPALVSLLALSTSDPTVGDQNSTPVLFNAGSPLAISSPTAVFATGTPATLDFIIRNNEGVSDTFQLATAGTGGYTVLSTVPTTVTIASGGTTTVSIVIDGGAGLDGTTGNELILSATSTSIAGYQGSGTATVAFSPSGTSNVGFTLSGLTNVTAVTGATYLLTYTLTNSEDADGPDTFYLQTAASAGLTVIGSVGSLPPDLQPLTTSSTATQQLLVYAAPGTATGTVSLIASSRNHQQSATATTAFTFSAPALLSGPATQAVIAGIQSTATFTIHNQGTDGDAYALSLSPSAAITIVSSTASPVSCAGGQAATVTVTFLATGPGSIGVTATSQDDPAFSASASDVISMLASLPANPIQSTPASYLIVSVTDQATTNVEDAQNGVANEVEEYAGPTYFNLFLDPNQADGVWSGIPNLGTFTTAETVSPFTSEGNQLQTAGATSTISTDVTAGAVEIDQAVTYVAGSWSDEHTWTLTNAAASDAQDLVLRYGGISTLHDTDNGIGLATPAGLSFGGQTQALPILYTIQPGAEGFYAIFPSAGNPVGLTEHFQEGPSQTVIPLLAEQVSGDFATQVLGNTVDADYPNGDAAVGWEFQIPGIASPVNSSSPYPASVSFSLYEAGGSRDEVQVVGQSQYTTSSPEPFFVGASVPVTFTVSDTSGLGGSYYLIAQGTTSSGTAALAVGAVSGAGVNATGAVPVLTLPANGQATVTVLVTGSAQALGAASSMPALVSLLALSTQSPTIGDQNSTALVFSSGPAVAITAPTATAVTGTPLTLDFTIHNNEGVSDTFALATAGTTGYTVLSTVPPSVTIASGGTATVSIVITGNASLAGTAGNQLTLSATSTTAPSYQGSGTATITFSPNGSSNVGFTLGGPGSLAAVTGAIYTLSYTLTNTEGASDVFTLQATASSGITIIGSVGGLPPDLPQITTAGTAVEQLLVYAAPGTATGTVSLLASSSNLQQSATATATLAFSAPALLSGPATQAVSNGVLASAAFTISNQGTLSDTYAFTLATTAGISVVSATASPVLVGGGQSTTVTVYFLATGPGSITLVAASQTNPAFTASLTDAITINAVTATNPVVVTAPTAQSDVLGTPVGLTFTLTNAGTAADTFQIALVASANITIQSALDPSSGLPIGSSVALAPQQTQEVVVTILGQSGSTGSVSLTGTSTADPTNFATASVPLTFTVPVAGSTPVVVTPPSAQQAAAGSPVLLTFVVSNQQSIADTFDLSLVVPAGVSVISVQQPLFTTSGKASTRGAVTRDSGPTLPPLALQAGESATLVVSVVATPSTTAAVDDVQLVATSQTTPAYTDSATVALSVAATTTTTYGAAVVTAAPSVPVSTTGNTVYGPISPGTPEAAARILSTLTALGPQHAVGYCFDATQQAFVELPTQPTGGLLPTTGIFVASSTGLTFDLSGSSTVAPATITLLPGWNFIGIPPIDPGDGTAVRTSHAFPADFDLLDGTGTLVTSAATFADILGTVGSGAVATAEPFLFNGTGYSQVATLSTGIGYWIKNNTATPVTLQRVLTAATLSVALQPRTDVTDAEYIDRGRPPTPPSSSLDGANGGSGCGLASGAGMVLLMSMLAWRRRRL